MPDCTRLMDALAATWPPASADDAAAPGWRLRDGAGGGKRVSAAVSLGGTDFKTAEAAMRARGLRPMIQLTDDALDAALAGAGWAEVDPTVLMVGDAAALADIALPKGVRWAFVRARVALIDEVWEAGGIGPARRAVMARAPAPKITVMARTDLAVAGVGFVAVDRDVAMLHAVEVRADMRRRGAGRAVLAGAARFAQDAGARWLGLAVTEANAGARALYRAAGMTETGRYRYREAPPEGEPR